MSRIKARFEQLAQKKQKALVAYVMVGYPTIKDTLNIARGLVKGGADIIELGFPFTDPLADGPVIQDAGLRSLENKTSLEDLWRTARQLRQETDIPLVVMTYANIIYNLGFARFAKRARDAGIDGLIIPDMSIDESKEYLESNGGLDTIFLVSPNTDESRMGKIARASSGFLYLVAVYGTTGSSTGVKKYTIGAIKRAKKSCQIPLGVGFGVSTPQDVRRYVLAGADAVIVGSAYLKLIAKTPRSRLEDSVSKFTRQLKQQTRIDSRIKS